MKNKPNQLALRVSLIYCLIAVPWILFSDRLLARFVTDPVWLTDLQTFKGLAFVAVSALIFYFMLRDTLRRWEKEAVERTQAEMILRASQEKMRAVFDAEPECLKLLEPDATVCEINPAGLRIIEADSVAAVVGKSILPLVAEEYRGAVLAMLAAAAGGEKRNLEFKITGFKGTIRWLDMHAVPVCDPATGRKLVLAVSRDMTERKRAEASVSWLARQNELILNTVRSGIWGLDMANNATFINAAAAHMLGYEPQELIGRNTHAILHHSKANRQPHPIDECPIHMALRDGREHSCDDDVFWRKDGTSFPVRYVCNPMVDDGKVVGAVVVFRDITEQKKLEAEVALSERRLNAFFTDAPAGLVLLDEHLRYVQLNNRVAELNGVTVKNHLGRTVREVLPKFAPVLEPLLQQVLATGKPIVNIELSGEKPNQPGVQQHLMESFFPILGKDGRPGGVGVIFVDITDSKRLEAEVALREQRLNAFFTNAPAGLVLMDKQLRYVQINDTVAKINGVSVKDHLGKTIREILPKLAPMAEPLLQQVLATGVSMSNVEISGETPARPGVLRHWMESFFPILGGDGKPEGVGAIFVEITDRKQAEDELRWKTAFLEAQVDSALDGIMVVDSQGKIILQNKRMNELWKLPRHVSGIINDAEQLQFAAGRTKNPDEFVKKVAYLYAHPDQVSRDEIELIDGTILDRYSSPVRDAAGKHYGRIWTFRDITEQRKLEAQFRQAQKMEAIGHLASGVAHDFNNVLAVIQIQADLLKTEPDPAKQREFAEEIGNVAQHAANLTRQLLLFSRQQPMQPREIELNEAVNNLTKMLQRTLNENIQLQFKFAAQPLFLHADPGMLDQVLMNLVVNARDAMPQGGRLVIETSAAEFDESAVAQTPQARPGSFVCLSVSDTGCGIPAENLPRIFEPFFTTKDVGKGTGLGLATVFGIVQQHKGWISVYSETGHGTTFRIYLPGLARVSDRKSSAAETEPARGGNETILLVEDNSSLRGSVQNTLARLGYRVLEASDGATALEVCKQHRGEIHLLFTDMVLPGGMNGKTLAGQMLQDDSRLKVIYVSGYSAEITSKDSHFEEGVNFLAKPFDATRLAKVVRDSLDR